MFEYIPNFRLFEINSCDKLTQPFNKNYEILQFWLKIILIFVFLSHKMQPYRLLNGCLEQDIVQTPSKNSIYSSLDRPPKQSSNERDIQSQITQLVTDGRKVR